jgi:hypothetical protein
MSDGSYPVSLTVTDNDGGLTDTHGTTANIGVVDDLVAMRDISDQSVAPGDTFTVTVDITVNADVFALILDEDVPAGWTVTQNDNGGGTYQEAETKWLWPASIPSGSTYTVVYDVTVPGGAANGDYFITGEVKAYLIGPFDVTGESQVTVSLLIGDINDDGHANVLDMILVGNHWDEEEGDPGWIPEYDLNDDKEINEGDMVIIGQNWTG